MRFGTTSVVAVVGGVAACSFLVDASNLSGGEPDGGAVVADASEERGQRQDAGPSDDAALPPPDASGSDAMDGALPRACDLYPDARLCDDFDVLPLGARWDDVDPLVGTLVLDASSPFSSPFFLEATVGAQAQNGFGPRLRKDFGVAGTVTVRARVRVESGKLSVPLRIGAVNDESHDIRLRHAGTSSAIEEVNYTLSQSAKGFSFAKSLDESWQEVVIRVSFASLKVEVTVAGVPAITQDLTIGNWTGAPAVSVFVGLPFVVTQTTTVSSGIDDVVVLTE